MFSQVFVGGVVVLPLSEGPCGDVVAPVALALVAKAVEHVTRDAERHVMERQSQSKRLNTHVKQHTQNSRNTFLSEIIPQASASGRPSAGPTAS